MANSTANQTAAVVEDEVQFEKQLGQLATFVRVMRQAGLPIKAALQMPIDDEAMRARLVRFWTCNGYEATTSQKSAREIMGNNMFGVEEAIKHFGVNPTRRQLLTLSEVPFTEEVLRQCKDTHVLVAVFRLPIIGVRAKVQDKGLFYKQDWYDKEAFASDGGEVSWQLVRKTPVDNSPYKTWDEQQVLLGKEEETPSAQVMVYTIIGQYLATGERLFERIYVRTSSVRSGGFRVCVGGFGAEGLDVNDDWVDFRLDDLGVASARKFE